MPEIDQTTAKIESLLKQIDEQQSTIIQQLNGKYLLNYLFGLAVAFEGYYRYLGGYENPGLMQQGMVALSNCTNQLKNQRNTFSQPDRRPLDKIHQGWLKRLSRNKGTNFRY